MISTRNGARRVEQPAQALRGNVRQLAGDIVTLAELQAELLQVDLRTWAASLVRPVILLFTAAVLALAGIPLLLVSLAYCLTRYTVLPMAASLAISAGVGFLAAGLCAWIAIRGLRSGSGPMRRFNAELKKNIKWFKEVLTRPNAPAASDIPREY